jgi:hypothetical protein
MRSIKRITCVIASPILGFAVLSLLTYILLSLDSYSFGKELSFGSSNKNRFEIEIYFCVAIPTLLYVSISNLLFFSILTYRVKYTRKALFICSSVLALVILLVFFRLDVRGYDNLYFALCILLAFLVSFVSVHLPGIYFYKLAERK